jgi:hypothetical protein
MRPRERAVGTIDTLLRAIGRPVESLDEFFHHFSSDRVIVQANGMREDPTKGHAAFFHKGGIYELRAGPDEFVRNAEFKARYPFYKASAGQVGIKYRSFIEKAQPETFSRVAQISHLIEKGRVFVLGEEYSSYFERAFEGERSNFVRMPYSYGVHYNCNTFALFTIKRMLKLKNGKSSSSRSLVARYAQNRQAT